VPRVNFIRKSSVAIQRVFVTNTIAICWHSSCYASVTGALWFAAVSLYYRYGNKEKREMRREWEVVSQQKRTVKFLIYRAVAQ
jgi:hypothetical protein